MKILIISRRYIKIKYNIQEIKDTNLEYPYLLSEIKDKPKTLYVVGNAKLLHRKSIAIVGSRDCTNYGAKVSEKLAYNLSKQNIIIVSGLARGIDTYAHIGCLKAGGKTIAVVAHGLDMIYPKDNRDLAIKIVSSGGAIISEYPVGEKPLAWHFPERNRIISGISQGIVVVEAKEKSGALITANLSLEYGRRVFAVPGNIFSENSKGTNKLIKIGAEVITEDLNIIDLNLF